MKSAILVTLTALLLSPIVILGQGGKAGGSPIPLPPLHGCAHETRHEQMLASDPAYAAMVDQINLNALNYANSSERNDDEIFTIPVVVHIIHVGEPVGTGSNISDEQVLSAIVALNNDFRKTPGTVGDGAGVDTKMQFCLAMRDPNGNSTSGIVRVDGRVVPLYETQGISAGGSAGANEGAVKALSTWPKSDYVNIWIVSEIEDNNAGNGIQGYAYFPSPSPLDGIVLLHNVFGTVGNLKPTHNLSRTTTHEMGHTFALFHTFHQSGNCDPELDCEMQGDRVCDTPKTVQNANCSNPACGGTQQVNNYLDYTSQTCRNMFTEGQKIRMRSTLFNERASLMTSMGCVPPSQFDIGISNISQPAGSSCNTTVNPVVTLVNFGGETITSASISYHINGMVFGSFNWTGSLPQGAQTQVALPAIESPFGTNTIYCYTENPNGQQDEYGGNDQASAVFTIVNGSTYTISANLDFFGGQNTWEVKDLTGATVSSGGPYPNNQQGTVHTQTTCLPEGCYTFHFYDTGNNGMSFLAGSYQLLSPTGTVIASGSGNFGSGQSHEFCVEAPASGGSSPTASFTQNTTQICQGGSIQFTNQSSGNPTSYSWSFPGGTPSTSTAINPTVTYNTAGNHSVTLTVTNAFGSHTITQTGLITVNAAPTVAASSTNVTCNGANNGSATLSVSGGGSPFTTTWSNGMSGNSVSGLAPGSYTATTINTTGCSTQTNVNITQPAALVVSISGSSPSCSGLNNGSATASATGGTGNKTFSWSNGQSGATATNLAPGTYTVTATDANGCTAQSTVNITAPAALTVSAATTQPTCANSNNGSASATASGGTGNKTFTWSNGQTGASATNLAPGSYTVTATDANGCSAQATITISAPAALAVTAEVTHPTCSSSNNGTAVASSTGGTGSTNFTWSNGQSGATASNLAAGSYSVTATDANGCTAQANVTLTAPQPMSVSATVTHPTCAGMSNGSSSATATGGTGTKTFSWSNGQSGSVANNLPAGSFTVTATDANGCSAQATVTVTNPSALTVSVTTTQIACGDIDNGTASAAAAGGTGTKTFLWSTGETGPVISNLSPGVYTVTATDANGCTAQASGEIDEPDGFFLAASSTNVTCHGAANGTATLTPSGGTLPISYQWTNGQTGSSISGLAPGIHSVTATDANGCTAQTAVGITQPPALNASVNASPIACFGETTGSATATATGGTGTKTFSWSNGQTGATASGLAAGSYVVTVTDANGCVANATANISQPSQQIINTTVTHIACNGDSNGSATASATGGTGGKTFAWSNGQTGPNAIDMAPGNHTVTVTDANGCQVQSTIAVTEPAALSVSATATQVTCNGANNGSATALASGGTGTKTYSWNNGQSGATISGLSAGTYTVTVTDENSCTAIASATVSQNSDLIVNLTITQITCPEANNGSATATAEGGSGNLSFLWSNGQSGQTIQNLGPGTYTLTVTDSEGCSFTTNAALVEPSPIIVTANVVHPSCSGASNGSATAAAVGGTGQKTFAWSNGQSGATASNLAPGTYTVTATDMNGCTAQHTVTLSQAESLSITLAANQMSCSNPNGGSITAAVNGGTGNISVIWNNGATGLEIIELEPGEYTATAMDENGCTAQATAEIFDFESFFITANSTNVTCHGAANGTASITQNGGTEPITYQWTNGQVGANISGLAPGIHSVTATDAAGCTAQTAVGITQPQALNVNVSSVNPSCADSNNGSASATATGGTGQKTFAWSTGQTGATIQNVAPGTYTVTATDANGCVSQNTVTLTAPAAMTMEINANDALCFGENNGSATAMVSGGNQSVEIAWSNGQTGTSVQNLPPGNHSVTATDSNGCTVQTSFTIGQPEVLIVTASASSVSCAGGADATASAISSGGTGSATYLWSNGLSGAQINSLPAGTYSVTATDQNGCQAMSSATVTSPNPIVLQTSVSNALCHNESSGSATVTGSGGVGTLNFLWSNGQTGTTASTLMAGTYSVTATDGNGCQAQAQAVVGQPSPIVITSSVQSPTCHGMNNGSASAAATGGNGTLSFQWSNGQTGATAANLAAGSYLVTVSDASGCSASANVSVLQPEPLAVEVIAFDIACGNAGSGSAVAIGTGGTEPYNFQWSSGDQGDEVDDLAVGNHSITITDVNGCSASAAFAIQESGSLSVGVIVQNPTCFGGSDGAVSALAGGGQGPYSYYWDFEVLGSDVQGLPAGVYTVYAADINGCSGSMQVVLSNPPMLTISAAVTSPETCTEPGSALAAAAGGTGVLQYLWSDGTTDSELEAPSGSYVITVTDANLCQSTASVFIPLDCDEPVPMTFLDETSCGAIDLPLNGIIHCVPVPGAEMYQWSFENEAAGFFHEAYTLGNNPHMMLSQIPGLLYDFAPEVSVRAKVLNQWGEWGPSCMIFTTDVIPPTQLTADFCGNAEVELTTAITCAEVIGADEYEWTFEHGIQSIVLNSFLPSVTIFATQGFTEQTTYQVTVKARAGALWSAVETECQITIPQGLGMFDISEENTTIFPNPFDGHGFTIQFGLEITEEVEMEIFTTGGKLIARHRLPKGTSKRDINFENRLSSGMYVVKLRMNNATREYKAIVTN